MMEGKKINNDGIVPSTRQSKNLGKKLNLISCTKIFALSVLFLICKNCDNSTQSTSSYQEYQHNGLVLGKSRILSEFDKNEAQTTGYKIESNEDSLVEGANSPTDINELASGISKLKTDEESKGENADKKKDDNDSTSIGETSTDEHHYADDIASIINSIMDNAKKFSNEKKTTNEKKSSNEQKTSDQQKPYDQQSFTDDVDSIVNGIKSCYQEVASKVKSPEFQQACKEYIHTAKELLEEHKNYALNFVTDNVNSLGINQIFEDDNFGGFAILGKMALMKTLVDNLFIPDFLKNQSPYILSIVYFLLMFFTIGTISGALSNNNNNNKRRRRRTNSNASKMDYKTQPL
ncbi:exported protein IBIS1, putative [Plasmodium vinckei lentum]|uniref:Exported protein IBIS1, putative n=1 Tax=Plasmodium vinckei lentum TaxID=138297 RepID=A0A6V7SUN9_PLAVN|nr:exported protein IBIS1, putative [Plasmodium vinckei lentum]